jgi:hypothetical protein
MSVVGESEFGRTSVGINEDPYNEGWLVEVRLKNEAEIDSLMDMDEYYHLSLNPSRKPWVLATLLSFFFPL